MTQEREVQAGRGEGGSTEVSRKGALVLLATTLFIATSGIVYELLIAGYSAFLLGDSIYQFSLTIGLYLSAMGLGSYATRGMRLDLLRTFIVVELVIAFAGGLGLLTLSLAFAFTRSYELVMVGVTVLLGFCIGVEIPLVTRIIASQGPLRNVIANVLSFDYLGALVGSLALPLVLLPSLGFLRAALVVGLVNLAVALLNLYAFRQRVPRVWRLVVSGLVVGGALGGALVFTDALETEVEKAHFQGKVVHAEQSVYQRIVLTEKEDGHVLLTLNGHPQFSTRDEHRYHEALVHPPMVLARARARVLILGGGDGLALREVWKHPGVQRTTLVDLDPAMTRLATHDARFVKWNAGAMNDSRLELRHEDAWKFLERTQERFDVILVDLPDPTNISLSKLYSVEFYVRLKARLAPGGVVSIQSGEISPLRRKPFWCIVRTLRAAGLQVRPYALFLPTFGVYVWSLASHEPIEPLGATVDVPTRFLDAQSYPALFHWDKDLAELPVRENRIDTHVLLRYFFED